VINLRILMMGAILPWILFCILHEPLQAFTLNIGSFLQTYGKDGSMIPEGVASVAAFQMAIDELNNPPFLPGFDLKGTFCNALSTKELLSDMSSLLEKDIVYLISNLDTTQEIIVSKILNDFSMIQMIIGSNAAELSKGAEYPRQLRLVPSEGFDAIVLQELAANVFNYERVTVFSTTLFRHSKQLDLFIENTQYMSESSPLDILSSHILTPNALDYSAEIAAVKLRGANVFILFLDVRTAATLLEQAYNMSMLHEGTIVLCVGEIFDDVDISAYMSPDAPVDKILRGSFGVKYDLAHFLLEDAPGIAFVEKLRGLPPTAIQSSNGSLICNNATDGDGNYLYIRDSSSCDLSDFAALTTDDAKLAALVYDSVYTIAEVLKATLSSFSSIQKCYDFAVNQTKFSFTGVSGEIAFSDVSCFALRFTETKRCFIFYRG
jgi:hypothetical protein